MILLLWALLLAAAGAVYAATDAPVAADAIHYKHSGRGAVARTIGSKLAETVSAKDYGVVCDGMADDSAAFNAAIKAVGSGGVVMVPPGNCKTTSPILAED